MNCADYEILISAEIDRENTEEQSQLLLHHLSECTKCKMTFDKLLLVHKSLCLEDEMPEGVSAALRERIRIQTETKNRKKRALINGTRKFTALAACFVIILGASAFFAKLGGQIPQRRSLSASKSEALTGTAFAMAPAAGGYSVACADAGSSYEEYEYINEEISESAAYEEEVSSNGMFFMGTADTDSAEDEAVKESSRYTEVQSAGEVLSDFNIPKCDDTEVIIDGAAFCLTESQLAVFRELCEIKASHYSGEVSGEFELLFEAVIKKADNTYRVFFYSDGNNIYLSDRESFIGSIEYHSPTGSLEDFRGFLGDIEA